MLRVGELTERGMLTASIRPRNALRLKGLVPLLGLTRDRRRRRILDLQPAVGATGAIRGSQPLRHDALTAERASLTVDDRAVRNVCFGETAMA